MTAADEHQEQIEAIRSIGSEMTAAGEHHE